MFCTNQSVHTRPRKEKENPAKHAREDDLIVNEVLMEEEQKQAEEERLAEEEKLRQEPARLDAEKKQTEELHHSDNVA